MGLERDRRDRDQAVNTARLGGEHSSERVRTPDQRTDGGAFVMAPLPTTWCIDSGARLPVVHDAASPPGVSLSLLRGSDMFLTPCADTGFNRAKSDRKFIESGPCCIPAVASVWYMRHNSKRREEASIS
jgi:hypothetical protein